MRLYSRTNATAIDDPGFGHFELVKNHGGFDLPDELAERLHSVCFRGKPAWETEIERDERLHGEETARRRDPESMYGAVENISALLERLAGLQFGGAPSGPSPEVEALSKQVEALTAKLEAMQAPAGDDDTGSPDASGPAEPAKSSGGRKTPASKT